MNKLKNLDVKLQVIELDDNGLNGRQIFEETGVPQSTSNDFLRKLSWQQWWAEYEAEVDTGESVGEAIIEALVEANAMHKGCDKVEAPVPIEDELDQQCESNDWHIASLAKRLRTAQRTNSQLRKSVNKGIDSTTHFPSMIKAVEDASATLNLTDCGRKHYSLQETGAKPAIMEILFSDWQIGKVGQYYNSELGERALAYYGSQLISLIDERKAKYTLDKIIFASLGDIVEDHLKHGVQSATSTDCGLSEQMAKAIIGIWEHVIQPIGELGVPVEVICIAGNHGSSEHKGMDMYKAGLYSYDYAIYKALEGYCKVAGYSHVKFIQPEGCFGYTDIYGRYAVYEHGYFNSCTEKSLQDQLGKRSNQIKRHVEYFRCGDMHHVCAYDNAKLVVNGAFFGADDEGVEYSGILGFNAIPAQVVMFHTDEKSIGKNTVSEFITVQVAEGY